MDPTSALRWSRGRAAPSNVRRGATYQRNEIRFQPRKDLLHDLRDPHYYSITFRTEGDIPSCGSARWVIAQWKEPDGESPFLAQRYDNGVLHVTVQNDDCRCVVAKAGGDPDRLLASFFGAGIFCCRRTCARWRR